MSVKSPRGIELFAGCGGLSTGFLDAGLRVAAGFELDQRAVVSDDRASPRPDLSVDDGVSFLHALSRRTMTEVSQILAERNADDEARTTE